MSQTLVTAGGLPKLHARLEQLHLEREESLRRVKDALAHGGGRPENGEYLDAQHELTLLERRISLLEERLENAEVVEVGPADGELDVGEQVRVRDLETRRVAEYRVVGSGEADPAAGDISHASPVGAALLGCRAGDVVEIPVPRGTVRLEVLEVRG